MELAKRLKNFNLFVEGVGYPGKVKEIELPKLGIKTEEVQCGGMDAPIEADMGMEKIEMSFTLAQAVKEVYSLYGLGHNNLKTLIFKGAESDGNLGVVPIVITVKGMIKEQDTGSPKTGEGMDTKFTVAAQYYEENVDGTVTKKIDILNMIREINGTDVLASIRGAIGL